MLSVISKLFATNTLRTAFGRRSTRLHFDALERRDVPASILLNPLSGVVTISGSSENDVASVAIVNNKVQVKLDCYSSAPPNLSFFSDVKNYALVTKIEFDGYDGADRFTNNTSIPSEADGGEGNDQLTGGTAADFFIGNYGNDTISGNGGNDKLWGSGGHDLIDGGSGKDVIQGHGGNDTIHGGDDADSIFGGSGDDKLYGDAGMDVIVSIGGGNDTITGGAQWDNVWMDTTDSMTDPSANENDLGYVHKINQFYRYSFDGGMTSTAVSKELTGEDLADPMPEAGQQWMHNFDDNPLFASGGPTKEDVIQDSVDDCYFLSRLAAMAKANPESIKKMVVDLGDGTYAVRFFRNSVAEYVRVDADFYVSSPGGAALTCAHLGQQDSIWAPVVEKAYAFWRKQQGSYPSINGGNGGTQHVSQDLLGGAVNDKIEINSAATAQDVIDWVNSGSPSGSFKTSLTTAVKNWLKAIKDALVDGKAVVVGHKFGVHDGMALTDTTWRRGEHVTTVDAVLTDAKGNVTGIRLRDQYGETNSNGYDHGFVTITDFTRIFFCLGSAGVMTV